MSPENDPPRREGAQTDGSTDSLDSSVDRIDALLSQAIGGGAIPEGLPGSLAFVEECLRQATTDLFASAAVQLEPSSLTGKKLGDFLIVRPIGSGAMGVVFEAIQESLSRRVAIKILPPAASISALRKKRFEREAEAIGRLENDSIVRVHAFEEIDDYSLLVMELVPGCSLAELIRQEQTQSFLESAADPAASSSGADAAVPESIPSWGSSAHARWIAERAAEVAEALEAAHRQGIIHRDIKPGNVLVASAHLWKIADFGIAQVIWDENLTVAGQHPGTLIYSSPEQSDRTDEELDPRTDVYSLGATLYECLTLHPPIEGRTNTEKLTRIKHGVRLPIRKHNPRVPLDLATIVTKALEPNREKRYATARDMADDLRRFLANEPVLARTTGPVDRAVKWTRRRPTLALAIVLVVALPLAVGTSEFLNAQNRLREQIQRQEILVNRYRHEEPTTNPDERIEGLREASGGAADSNASRLATTEALKSYMDQGRDPAWIRDSLAKSSGREVFAPEIEARLSFYECRFGNSVRWAQRALRDCPAEETATLIWLKSVASRFSASRRSAPFPLPSAVSDPLSGQVAIVKGFEPRTPATYLVAACVKKGSGETPDAPILLSLRLDESNATPRSIRLAGLLSEDEAALLPKAYQWGLFTCPSLSIRLGFPTVGLLFRVDPKRPPESAQSVTQIRFLKLDEEKGQWATLGPKLVIAGGVNARAVKVDDVDGDGMLELVVGTVHPERTCLAFPLADTPLGYGEPLRLDNRDSDVRSVLLMPAREGGFGRAYLALGDASRPGLGVVRLDPGQISSKARPETDYYPYGFVDDLLAIDVDGDQHSEIAMAKIFTELRGQLYGAKYERGVREAIYVYRSEGPGLSPVSRDGESRIYLAASSQVECRTNGVKLSEARFDGRAGANLLSVRTVETESGELRSMRVDAFESTGPDSLAPLHPLHIRLLPATEAGSRGIAASESDADLLPAMALAADIDGDGFSELILVGEKNVIVFGEGAEPSPELPSTRQTAPDIAKPELLDPAGRFAHARKCAENRPRHDWFMDEKMVLLPESDGRCIFAPRTWSLLLDFDNDGSFGRSLQKRMKSQWTNWFGLRTVREVGPELDAARGCARFDQEKEQGAGWVVPVGVGISSMALAFDIRPVTVDVGHSVQFGLYSHPMSLLSKAGTPEPTERPAEACSMLEIRFGSAGASPPLNHAVSLNVLAWDPHHLETYQHSSLSSQRIGRDYLPGMWYRALVRLDPLSDNEDLLSVKVAPVDGAALPAIMEVLQKLPRGLFRGTLCVGFVPRSAGNLEARRAVAELDNVRFRSEGGQPVPMEEIAPIWSADSWEFHE